MYGDEYVQGCCVNVSSLKLATDLEKLITLQQMIGNDEEGGDLMSNVHCGTFHEYLHSASVIRGCFFAV